MPGNPMIFEPYELVGLFNLLTLPLHAQAYKPSINNLNFGKSSFNHNIEWVVFQDPFSDLVRERVISIILLSSLT